MTRYLYCCPRATLPGEARFFLALSLTGRVTTADELWVAATRHSKPELSAMDSDFLAMECAARYRGYASLLDPGNTGSIQKDKFVQFVEWWAAFMRQVPAEFQVSSPLDASHPRRYHEKLRVLVPFMGRPASGR
jgi:hypothetical protein